MPIVQASPSVSQLQARDLAGKSWQLHGEQLRFADYDPGEPGQPPWKTGSEGIAYPLYGSEGTPRAYVKFFDALRVTTRRVERTKWLIGQQIGSWAPELAGAPASLVETHNDGPPLGISFEFACSFAQAVPGRTWLEVKLDVADGQVQLDDPLRMRCVRNLLSGLVHLEQRDIVHGDLSPNNIIVDVKAHDNEPSLYLIDFDGFVAPAAGQDLYRLPVADGGTYGTKGYCPPDLEQRAATNDRGIAPYSDRYARDMLLLELLCFDDGCDFEAPVSEWPGDPVRVGFQRVSLPEEFAYLGHPDVFTMPEGDRPSTASLAKAFQITIPPRVKQSPHWGVGAHAFMSPNPPSFASPAVPQTHLLATATHLLWLCCVGLLGLICLLATQWFGGSSGSWAHAVILLPIQVLIGGGLFVGGFTWLTVLTFTTDRPRIVKLLGWWFRIPARLPSGHSELEIQLRKIGVLSAVLIALGLGVMVLQVMR